MNDLKQRTVRGGVARLCAQAANFAVRLVSLMILARLLGPKEFGLVGMVTALTGVLNLFRDFGLSAAAIQRTTITDEQLSTLFWINIFVGVILALLAVGSAPAIAAFYNEPKLLGISIVMSIAFLLNAAGVQHSAMLQRQMRFTTLAVIGIVSLVVSNVVGIGAAELGCGYWALVAMTLMAPLTSTVGCWLSAAWIPGMPHRHIGSRSMIRFGGTLTLNGLVAYAAYNTEKILIGRFWGASAIGIYGRAYQLVSIPTDNLNSAVGEVAFAALSRVKDDPTRLRSYFLKGYSLVLGLTLPITIACALFSPDLIAILLGQKWMSAVSIFRLLSPTIAIFAIVNPLGWLLSSLGLVARGFKIALVFAPFMIGGYLIGLPHGPEGVALAYSAVLAAWAFPLIALCVRGTVISVRDILIAVSRPLVSALAAGGVALLVRLACGRFLHPLAGLLLEGTTLLVTYAGMLLFVVGEKSLYLDIVRGLRTPAAVPLNS